MSSFPTGSRDGRLTSELRGLARLRQASYRFLAGLFLYPEAAHLAHLAGVAGPLARAQRAAGAFAGIPWGTLEDLLRGASDGAGSLEEPYVRLFWLGEDGGPLLSEAAYGASDPALLMCQLEVAYAGAGVDLRPGIPETPDHLAVELEFVGVLCGREADAWRRRATRRARELAGREAGFLAHHPARWAPLLTARMEAARAPALYGLAAAAVADFVGQDLVLARWLARGAAETPPPSAT